VTNESARARDIYCHTLHNNPRGTTSVTYTLTFDAPVAGVDASDFTLTTTGTINGAALTAVTPVAPANGLATTWTIDVAPGAGWGTLRLDLLDDDTIHDAANRPLGGAGADNGTFFGFDATLEPAFSFADTTAKTEGQPLSLTFNTDYYTPPADTLWTIDWGDSHTESQTTSIPTFNHNYTSGDGSYDVCALATAADGSTLYTSDFIPVTVAPVAPIYFNIEVLDNGHWSVPEVRLMWEEYSNLVGSFDLYYRREVNAPSAAANTMASSVTANAASGADGDIIDPVAQGYTLYASNISYGLCNLTMYDLPRAGTYTFLLVAVNAGGRTISSAEAIVPDGQSGQLDSAGYGESECVRIGFQINFYGTRWDFINVNENGTVSFRNPFQPYPTDNSAPDDMLAHVSTPVIAPFWSGISTESINDVPGGVITYGPETGVVDPLDNQVHQTFAVHWTNVDRSWREWGYHQPLCDTFSLYLFDRNDRGLGDFDFAFVYDGMEWDSIDTSAEIYGDTGPDCNDGYTARAGFSNGTGIPGTFYELPGSGERGGLLDTISSLPNRTFSYAVHNPSAHFELLDTSPLGGKTSDTNKGVLGVVRDGNKSAELSIHLLPPPDDGYSYVFNVLNEQDMPVTPPDQTLNRNGASTDFFVLSQALYTVKVTCPDYPGYFEESAQFYFAHLSITWAGETTTYGTGGTMTTISNGTNISAHPFDLFAGQHIVLSYNTDGPAPIGFTQWMPDTKCIKDFDASTSSGHVIPLSSSDFLSTQFAAYQTNDVQGFLVKLLITVKVGINTVKCYTSATLNIHKPGRSIWTGRNSTSNLLDPDLFQVKGLVETPNISPTDPNEFCGLAEWRTTHPSTGYVGHTSYVQLAKAYTYDNYGGVGFNNLLDYRLDTKYPYDHTLGSPDCSDQPHSGKHDLFTTYQKFEFHFLDWLMWTAPGIASIPVPIQTWDWETNGSATWNTVTRIWDRTPGFVPAVGGAEIRGTNTDKYPDWTKYIR
jgi:hypothetical protein